MTAARVVLVRPRSPGNVGSVARAMKNFGLGDLVLVDPRLNRHRDAPGEEPYFERESRRMAWHAADVLDGASTVASLEEALAPCSFALATAPRAHARFAAFSPEEGAERLAGAGPGPGLPALVFGSESSGLTTDELARCAGVVVIPTDPVYRDLNVAQSVVLMAYLTFRALRSPRAPYAAESASQSSREGLAEVLDTVAREAGFLKAGSGPVALELRQMVHRLGLTRRDTEILRALLRRALHRMEKAGGE